MSQVHSFEQSFEFADSLFDVTRRTVLRKEAMDLLKTYAVIPLIRALGVERYPAIGKNLGNDAGDVFDLII